MPCLDFDSQYLKENMHEFAYNQSKRIIVRIKHNHFEKAYGFKPNDSKNKKGPKLFEMATNKTTFSGISAETTWNNTNVIGAALEYAIEKASISKYELLTVGDDILCFIENEDRKIFKQSCDNLFGLIPGKAVPLKLSMKLSRVHSDFLSKNIMKIGGRFSVCR